MRKKWQRRDVLKAIAAGGLLLAPFTKRVEPKASLLAQEPESELTPKAYLPLVAKTEPGGDYGGKVVHIHASGATSWDFGTNHYADYVDQDVVNEMVDQGVQELTGASTLEGAWRALVPNYIPGKGIAIKINLNNSFYCDRCQTGCADWQLKTDALIQPVNAVVRGLALAYPSLSYSDIWVYDATVGRKPPVSHRQIPQSFKDDCPYTGVRFFDQGCSEGAGYASSDPSAQIVWRNLGGIPTPPARQVTDVLVNATYVINMPIIKKHGGTEVTLSFKNHAGSVSNFAPFHDWVSDNWGSHYSSIYNPLVDIYRNPHIGDKTVLTIADGLFGNWERNETKSQPWLIFGNQAANSVLFATDPVAIDCVMCDLLDAESVQRGSGHLLDMADDYLVLAAAAELGTYERGDPLGSGYGEIDYQRIEL